jgi:hypothetical protein
MHKPQVAIDLSGWTPKRFPTSLVKAISRTLSLQALFGSDYPLITPDRWLRDFAEIDLEPSVRTAIIKENAVRLLGLG